MIKLFGMKHARTHARVHVKLATSERGLEIVSMSASWLRCCITVLQDVTVGGNPSEEHKGISSYYFLPRHVNLQASQDKKFGRKDIPQALKKNPVFK